MLVLRLLSAGVCVEMLLSAATKQCEVLQALTLVYSFYLPRLIKQIIAFFNLTRFVLVKYSLAFVKRPSRDTSSLASRLTTVSLDIHIFLGLQEIPEVTEAILCVSNKVKYSKFQTLSSLSL